MLTQILLYQLQRLTIRFLLGHRTWRFHLSQVYLTKLWSLSPGYDSCYKNQTTWNQTLGRRDKKKDFRTKLRLLLLKKKSDTSNTFTSIEANTSTSIEAPSLPSKKRDNSSEILVFYFYRNASFVVEKAKKKDAEVWPYFQGKWSKSLKRRTTKCAYLCSRHVEDAIW